VVALSDGETGYACEPAPGGGAGGLAIVARPLTPHEAREWVRIANAHQGKCAPMHTRTTKANGTGRGWGTETNLRRRAVDLGPVALMVGVVPLRGLRRTATGALVRVRVRPGAHACSRS
jgi:hypothetical protein